ncbi:M15 family metallopeptidase [Actinotalea solisilvae]|uniref:M15 family metallopeptidase n=1 Tax=Actinotalea solisilvae TaxID=2072922 RepID=UPI0018F16842|nr:M15 family metallopeptidase [Actinotalea solisilvae]
MELSPVPGTTSGVTRRELRLAAAAAAALEAADDVPSPTSARGAAGAPLTRRALRAAEAARAAAAQAPEAAPSPEPVEPVGQAESAPAEPPAVAPVAHAASPTLVGRLTPAAPASVTRTPTDATVAPAVFTSRPAGVDSAGRSLSTLSPSTLSLSTPVTRRELRLKQQAACPPPFPLLDPATAPAVAAAPRTPGTRAAKSATALALSGALLVSGFALQDGASATATPSAAALAAQQQRLHTARVHGAETARLTTQAEAYAATQRTRALEVAASAVTLADAAVQSATPLVQADAVAPLDEKVAELEAMMGAAEEAAPAAAPAPSPEDTLREAAVERASRSGGSRAALPVEATAAGEGVAAPLAPVAPVTDLEATQEMFAIAEQVAALTAQVQAATQARLAEEAARAAAEAAAAAIAERVAIATAAPNGEIPTSALCAPAFAPDELLRCDAAAALEQLNSVYRAEFGRDLSVVSSYRSYGMQVATRRSRGGLAATPGTSNHGRAVAVDFGDFGRLGSFRDPDYLWMKEHGADFGWYHPELMEPGGGGPQEPWHWEYGTDTGWDGPGL